MSNTIDIIQANEWEKAEKIINNKNEFITELSAYEIKDISQIKIKQDKQRYIFEINGKNQFAIDGKYNLKNYIQAFYDSQLNLAKSDEFKRVFVRMNGLEIQLVTANTREELTLFKNELNTSQQRFENANNIPAIKKRIEQLQEYFSQQKVEAQKNSRLLFNKEYDRYDKWLWNLNELQLQIWLRKLNKIQKEVENLENKPLSTKEVTAFVQQKTVQQLTEEIDVLSQEAENYIVSKSDIIREKGDSNPYFGIDTHTAMDESKLRMILAKIKNNQAYLNKLELPNSLHQYAIQDLKALGEYLEKTVDNPNTFDPIEEPFVPAHAAIFKYMFSMDPELREVFSTKKEKKIKKDKEEKNTGNDKLNNQQTDTNQQEKNNKEQWTENNEKEDISISSYKEAFEKKWVNGMVKYALDQTHMSPEQKNFWWGTANLAMIGGMAFLGWKFFRNAIKLFSKKWRGELADGGWWWIAAPLLAVGVTQWLTGESPWSLLNGGKNTEALMGLFGGKKGKEQQNGSPSSQEQQQYVEWFNGAMSLFNGKSYKEIQDMLEKDADGKMKIKPDYYDTWKATLEKGTPEQKLAASFLSNIGKDDQNGMIDLALTGMWITWETLSATPNESFNEKAGEVIIRLGQLYGYMEASGKNLNPETMEMVRQYIKTWNPSLDNLKARYDVFETPVNLGDDVKKALKDKIETLAITDPKQKRDFTQAFYHFYQNFPAEADTKKYIDITKKGDDIILKTYHYETKIDLGTKTIPGLLNANTYPLAFDSYQEMLNAANLTNRIKFLTKDWEAQWVNPFIINSFGNIEFNNTKRYDLSELDKRILTEEGLNQVSPKLWTTQKEAYVKYLNDLWTRKLGKHQEGFISSIMPIFGGEIPTEETFPDGEVKEYPDKLASSYTTIENLQTTPENKKLIRKALNMFYEKYPRKDIKVELTWSWPLLTLETYSKKTELDFDNTKKLKWLNVDFDNYFEIFKAANLTNRLRDIFKNNQAKSIDPFHVDILDITFDDVSFLSLEKDTSAISAWLFGDLRKVSRKLANDKDLYTGYLNNLWLMEDKATGFYAVENANLPFDTTQNIIKGFKEFYKKFPNSNKEVKFISGKEIAFQSYETKTPLDLVGKKIVGLDVTFPDYNELFKAANLINRIKQVTKDKKADSEPFNKSLFGRDIEFNQDNKFLDTEAVSAGLRGTLHKISPALEENKNLFITYMDERRADKLAGKPY